MSREINVYIISIHDLLKKTSMVFLKIDEQKDCSWINSKNSNEGNNAPKWIKYLIEYVITCFCNSHTRVND